uniref:Uncharacterized protein n=1 Tax=Cacopsylla melanoneura TaxID=428564 RepID=A0A8D9BF36_9HEMI
MSKSFRCNLFFSLFISILFFISTLSCSFILNRFIISLFLISFSASSFSSIFRSYSAKLSFFSLAILALLSDSSFCFSLYLCSALARSFINTPSNICLCSALARSFY